MMEDKIWLFVAVALLMLAAIGALAYWADRRERKKEKERLTLSSVNCEDNGEKNITPTSANIIAPEQPTMNLISELMYRLTIIIL